MTTEKKTKKKPALKLFEDVAEITPATPLLIDAPKPKKKKTKAQLRAELAKLPIQERIKRASRRFKVMNLEELDAVFFIDPRSPLCTTLNEWNWRFLTWNQKSQIGDAAKLAKGAKAMPLEVSFMQVMNASKHDNPLLTMANVANFTHVDSELGAAFSWWHANVYEKYIDECLYQDRKFPFTFLDTILNRLAAPGASTYDEDDEDALLDTNKLPYMVLGKTDKKLPNLVKFINASTTYSMFGVYVACQVQRYRWQAGALRTVQLSHKIHQYAGEKSLTDLGIVLKPKSTLDGIAEQAAEGRRVIQLNQNPSYVLCSDVQEIKTFWSWRRIPAAGRAMIDQEGMQLIDPESSNAISNYAEQVNMESEVQLDAVSDLDFAMVDQFVYGFSFTSKLWGRFHVTSVSNIDFREDAFEKLVIDQDDKDLILALVKNTDPNCVSDFVEGKGGGCAFLFHGKPGLGKTLTAEAVAETVKRPLYAASVGELGTDVQNLEENLNRILQLAARWNAVLLLDEADIFLETRSDGDIHRNAMVGTFLRLLEYYNGILILTSNRVKSIDPAFYSRISFARKYKEHDNNTREKITRNLLEVNEITNLTSTEIEMLSRHDVNGRQLKNSIRLARSLATAQNRAVTASDISNILTRVQRFAEELVGDLD